MEKILIFGTTMFSKQMWHFLKAEPEKYEVLGFTLDKEYMTESTFCGENIYAFEDLDKTFDMSEIKILLSVGYKNMNDNRKIIYMRCKQKDYMIASYIHPSVVNHAKKIGEGNIILDFVQLDYDCEIGNCNIIKGTSDFAHDSCIGDFNYFAGLCHICGAVKIGNQNFLGVSCLIRSLKSMGNKNLIGATAYMDESIGDCTIVSPTKSRIVKSTEHAIALLLE